MDRMTPISATTRLKALQTEDEAEEMLTIQVQKKLNALRLRPDHLETRKWSDDAGHHVAVIAWCKEAENGS